MDEQITKRQAEIVHAVVNGYLNSGQPVGSAIIVEKFVCNVSSATVRKEMSILEQMGYLFSPHTSAGRVPTDKAVELYVDELIRLYDGALIRDDELEMFYKTANVQLDKLLKVTAQQLSAASESAGLVLAPQASGSVIKQIELVSITENIVLMVMVSRSGSIFQKKIKLETPHHQEELYKISRFLNHMLKGHEVGDIREKGLSFFIDSSHDLGDLGASAMQVAQNLVYMPPDQQVIVEGEAIFYKRLLEEHPDTRLAEKLIRKLEDKSFIHDMINEVKDDDHVNVRVGIEMDGEMMHGVAVLARSYCVGGRNVGALGVIGMSRMPYEKTVRSLGYSSEILSNVLKERNELEFNQDIVWGIDGLPAIRNRGDWPAQAIMRDDSDSSNE